MRLAALVVPLLSLTLVAACGRDGSAPDPEPTIATEQFAPAALPEYFSGEGVSWLLQWPWLDTSGLCGEEVTSNFEDLPRPGHGLTSEDPPSDELRVASRYLGLEWEGWEGRWFDRWSVTLYRRTPWTNGSRRYVAAARYLVHHGDPPRWDETQSELVYECDGPDAPARASLEPIHIDLDGRQVDVRYGAVVALITPKRLPDIDLEANCVEISPGSIEHRYGRHQAKPHGLAPGTLTASDLPPGLRGFVLEVYEHLWATEHRVMAFSRTPLEANRVTYLARVREYGLIGDDGEERWVELASGSVWTCGD